MTPFEITGLGAAFFLIATLYSSAGFGGGSSYIALLALCLTDFYCIRSLALLCNLLVVGGSTYLFFKNGHVNWKSFLLFVLASMPLAFMGASLRLEEELFFSLLGMTLIAAAIALFLQTRQKPSKDHSCIEKQNLYPLYLSPLIGGGIGFLSGLVGIGGGIFLSPILHYMHFDRAIRIAALASFFILVNSIAGIGGLLLAGTFQVPVSLLLVLGICVFLGGQLGVRTSLKVLGPIALKRITALLVLVVGVRVLLVSGMGLL